MKEDKLLENVSVSMFPEKLQTVTGKISCNRAQYEQFGDRLQQVAQNPKAITVHEWQ